MITRSKNVFPTPSCAGAVRMLLLLSVVCVACLFDAIVFAQPATQPAADAKPYLSPITITGWTGNRGIDGEPVPGKTLSADGIHWDTPFALNVPVEQPFEGGKVRIYYVLRERWNTPETTPPRGSWFGGSTHGVYTADPTLAAGVSIRDGSYGDPLKPSPRSTTQPIYPIIGSSHQGVERGEKHLPFTDEKGETRLGEHVSLEPAKPGWYVLYWQMANGTWPGHARQMKSLDVTLTVDTLVCRGEGPGSERLSYLLGRGPKPTSGEFDEKSVRIATHELKITFKKDGWTFSRTEVTPTSDTVKTELATPERTVERGPYKAVNKVSSTVNAGGPTTDLKVHASVDAVERGKPLPQLVEDLSWKVEFPQVVLDHEVADVTVTAKREIKPEGADFGDYVEKPFWFGRLEPGCSLAKVLVKPGVTKADFARNLQSNGVPETPQYQQLWSDESAQKIKSGVPAKFRFYQDGGAYPGEPEKQKQFVKGHTEESLFEFECGPWTLKTYYRRLREVDALPGGGRTDPGAVTAADEKDPFWKWYPGFCRRVRERFARIDDARSQAGLTGVALRELRDTNDRVVQVIQDASNQPPKEILERLRTQARQRGLEIAERLAKLDELTTAANAAVAEVLADLEKTDKQLWNDHPELFGWLKTYREMSERISFEMALAGGDDDRFLAAVEAGQIQALSAGTRMMRAQALLRRRQSVAALFELRDVLKLEPQNAEAARQLAELESVFLKTCLDKSQGAMTEARAAFVKYMESRHFGEQSPAARSLLVRAVLGPLDAANREELWAIFSTGITGAVSGILGRPGDEARVMEANQAQMATAFLGLHAAMRLRAKGHTFLPEKESSIPLGVDAAGNTLPPIRDLTSAQILKALPLKDLQGNPYTEQQAIQLGVAIHEALQLPDVRALMTDDRATLEASLKKSYFDPRDVTDTAAESFGDLVSSPKALLPMLLPCATLTVAGRATTVGEVVAETVGWSRAVTALGGTRIGGHLLTVLERMHGRELLLLQQERFLAWAGVQGAKIVGLFALQYQVVSAAERAGGPTAVIVVEAVLQFIPGDTELLVKWLRAGHIPKDKVVHVLEQFVRQTRAASQELEATAALRERLRRANEARKVGNGVSPDELKLLEGPAPAAAAPAAPNGTPGHDVEAPLAAAAKKTKAGNNSADALEAADELAEDVSTQRRALEERGARAEQARENLHNAPDEPPAAAPVAPVGDVPRDWTNYRSLAGDPELPSHIRFITELDPDGCVPAALAALQPEGGLSQERIRELVRGLRVVGENGRLGGIRGSQLADAIEAVGMHSTPAMSVAFPEGGGDKLAGVLALGEHLRTNPGTAILAGVGAGPTGHVVLIWRVDAAPGVGAVVHVLDPTYGRFSAIPLSDVQWELRSSHVISAIVR